MNSQGLKSEHQMKINDFFENKAQNELQSNNNSRGYLQEIRLLNMNKEQNTINKTNKNNQRSKSKNRNKNKESTITNPFKKFFYLLKEKKFKERFNVFIEKGIFIDIEISKVFEIYEEYNTEINNSFLQDNDKLIKTINYFLNKGFNEKIRYIILKCLINYGIPKIEKFNNFFKEVNLELSKKKLNPPDKMHVLLYIEYINNYINNELSTNSLAKNKLISEFFFNNENSQIVKSNLNFIKAIKNNSENVSDYLRVYLENNFDNIFQKAKYELNSEFPKSKAVIIKILCNIVIKCDKIGYLNYKKIIDDYDIIFNGLTFKGNNWDLENLDKTISKKLFDKELSEKKFKNAIRDYFLIMTSDFRD